MPTDESVTQVRTIEAEADKVFAAWIDAAQLQRWLVPARRIVMSWVYEGPMVPTGKEPTRVEVECRPSGPKTEVRVHHEGLKNPTYRAAIRQGAWTEALAQLDSLLSRRPA